MQRDLELICVPSRDQLPYLEEEQLLYLLVELVPSADREGQARLPLDVCLVLDNSSSMRGDRLYQAKEAARYIVKQMTPADHFCLIVFNDRARVVVPRQPVRTPASLREHIGEIEPSGGTEMARAFEQALEQMRRTGPFVGVRRLILLTDGQTYGDETRCVELARQLQQLNVGITALGLGDDWNEDLMATIAADGNSRSEYISNAEAIVSLFQEEMRLLQGILAQEMSLSLKLASEVKMGQFFRVSPEVSPMPLRDHWEQEQVVTLGEWMGGVRQAFVLELVVSVCSPGEQNLLQVDFSYRLPREQSRRRVRYDLCIPCLPGLMHLPDVPAKVRVALEKVTAYRLQESAWREARQGNLEQATRRLTAAATRLVQMGEDDLARVIEKEALRMQRTGQVSAEGKKEIRYGTRRLGRRWFDRDSERQE